MMITSYCRGCYHLRTGLSVDFCQYILNTGHCRPCPAGNGCTQKISERKWNELAEIENLEGFETVKPKRRPRTNWTTGMISQLRELSEQGVTDEKIAEIMGLDVKAVLNKRINSGISKPKKYVADVDPAPVPAPEQTVDASPAVRPQKKFTNPMTAALVKVLESSPDNVGIVIDGKPLAEIAGHVVYDKNGDAQRFDIFLLTEKFGGNNNG